MVLSISQKEQAGPSWQVQGWTLSQVLQSNVHRASEGCRVMYAGSFWKTWSPSEGSHQGAKLAKTEAINMEQIADSPTQTAWLVFDDVPTILSILCLLRLPALKSANSRDDPSL